MAYYAYHFTVDPVQPGSEILMAVIAEQGFESFDNTAHGFIAYITEENAAHVDLGIFSFEDFTFSYTRNKIPDTNWNAEWEKNFEPVLVDDLLCIRAPFHDPAPQMKKEIVIMPKMSFGTGHHQTTRLMCREMFGHDLQACRVLDMGCGTGILAILAKMSGAGEVTGIDIDQWSVENAAENCAANGFPDIRILKGDVDLLEHEKPFDYILANINKNILKKHLPVYSAKILKGGKLFLSGFFTTDVEELRESVANLQMELMYSRNEAEWAMAVFKKTG
jgi:ribosomal protein L11 methyltransferase